MALGRTAPGPHRRDTNCGGKLSISTVLTFFLIAYLYIHLLILQPTAQLGRVVQQPSRAGGGAPNVVDGKNLDHASSSMLIQQLTVQQEHLNRRTKRLENMFFSYLSFGVDPFLYGKTSALAQCNNISELDAYCDKEECTLDMAVCLDDFRPAPTRSARNSSLTTTNITVPPPPCIVYDFGIRKEPDFGAILSRSPFECEVHAFDPSPITKKWFETSDEGKELQRNPKYTLHDYGGGGADETITLREYNWGQVSMYRYPDRVVNVSDCDSGGACRYHFLDAQGEFQLPVRSVSSVLKELGHNRIDVLKIDVEGSEYRMLEELILSGACLKVDQLTLEWHHYDVDLRYGEGSVPIINVFIHCWQKNVGFINSGFTIRVGGLPMRKRLAKWGLSCATMLPRSVV